MARTVQDLITEARSYIQDTEAGSYRYTDADLVNYLNNAILEIRRVRPDAFYGAYDDPTPQFTTSTLTSNFPLDEQFFFPTAHFIAGSAALRDDEHTVDARAIGLLNSFTSKLLVAKT